jgi:ATPase family protein associated with various cellular activities (AAA)
MILKEKHLMKSTLNISMRPHAFSEVIGLEAQVATLRSKLDTGEVPRAIMLTGPFGCGKTTLAYIIARAVQGWDFPTDVEPQVQEVNAGNYRKIDDMRKLADSAQMRPLLGKYGVIILDEAHRLTKDSQELLLKEFESENPSTVWIICTTEPESLIQGIRAGRCFTLKVNGMNADQRKELVERAAKEVGHTGDITDFLDAVTKGRVVSPRKILMAFESYHHGLPAREAIAAHAFEDLPEFHELAFAVIFGQWDKDVLDWRDKTGASKIKAVGEQFAALEQKLNKKPKEDTDEEAGTVEPEETQGKPEIARTLRAIVGGFLKGRVIKGGAKAETAALALDFLAHAITANSFELEWAATIGAMYRINKKLNGGK